ncbi:MAG TPA: hypothetical protein VFA75_16895 [Nevskia sp.]|jgi:hypothetical protein|nr:hypothetical protein [Nevskia sp.]
MLSALLIGAAAAASVPPSGITLGNADQYCAFQYGWQLATHNPLGSQQSFEECLKHPPENLPDHPGPLFPASSCIPSAPDAACQGAR